MAVTTFQDFPMADHDWDGSAAEKRVRKWADVEDGPNEKYRDAHVWYDGGVDLPSDDVDKVKRHLAKYYRKMDEDPPWDK